MLGIALAILKADALRRLAHDRIERLVVLGLVLAVAILRTRLVAVAVITALLLAVAIHPRPLAAGVALSVAAFVLVVAVFLTIDSVLRLRQNRE